MKIGHVTADVGGATPTRAPMPGGAGWVRVFQPAHRLAMNGHESVVGTQVGATDGGWLIPLNHRHEALMPQPELMVIQRWMNHESPDRIREARATGQVVLQDVDDWFWGLDPANRAHRTTSKKRNPYYNREHYRAAVSASDAAVVSTAFLAKRIRERFGCRTILVRNAVDLASFATQPVSDRDDELVIGWTGALAWRSGDLETLAPWFDGWLAATGSTFVHHGTFPDDTDTAASRAGVAVDRAGPTRGILPPWEYPVNVAGFDIGIVPLAPIDFNAAKSWIKGLEYAAAGIPFIAARTDEYAALGAGRLASDPDEWLAHLEDLRDPQVRAEEAARGLKVAAEHDLSVRWRDWETVYEAELARVGKVVVNG